MLVLWFCGTHSNQLISLQERFDKYPWYYLGFFSVNHKKFPFYEAIFSLLPLNLQEFLLNSGKVIFCFACSLGDGEKFDQGLDCIQWKGVGVGGDYAVLFIPLFSFDSLNGL